MCPLHHTQIHKQTTSQHLYSSFPLYAEAQHNLFEVRIKGKKE